MAARCRMLIPSEPVVVHGNAAVLFRAIGNLVVNALLHGGDRRAVDVGFCAAGH